VFNFALTSARSEWSPTEPEAAMDGWAAGSLLRHRTLGRGLVVAVEATALHVFFPGQETRAAAKLRWPDARPFLAEDEQGADPWLSGLSSFTLDRASGRYSLAANFIRLDEAVAAFAAEHPQGFAEPVPGRRAPAGLARGAAWRAAGEAWNRAVGDGKGAALLENGDLEDLARRLLGVATSVGGVPGLPDAAEWKVSLAKGNARRPFLAALLGYLSVPSPARARFDALAAAVQELGPAPETAWGMTTFFPFVAAPERHGLLLHPSTCHAAARLGSDLRPQPHPTWDTYARLRKLSARLLEGLRPLGARDHVDVEVFLHATGSRRAPAVPRGAAGRPRAPARPAPRTAGRRPTRRS
jgi:hypothetical protein